MRGYRYYSKEYKEMCQVLSIDFTNNAFCILPFDELEGGSQIEIIGLDKMEHATGLQDKHGKEYCQDDIFVDTRTDYKYRVVYRMGAFWGEPTNTDLASEYYCTVLLCHINILSERIGNIHEPPELLKDTP